MVAAYIHTGAKVGVLVEVGAGKEATVAHEDFKQLVRDITLQIAAGNPSVVSREQLPAAMVAKEREIAAEQVKNKPPQAIAKIVEGKLEKYLPELAAWWTRDLSSATPKSPSRSTSAALPSNWAMKSPSAVSPASRSAKPRRRNTGDRNDPPSYWV